MNKRADSSFFHEGYNGRKVLVLVPHQDDEVLTGAALTLRLTQAGADVYIVYATNGDWKYPAEIRYKEAAEAAGILGVDASHLFFLGYGDAYNNENFDHLFYRKEGCCVSASGHVQTYGANGRNEYAFLRYGEHRDYTSTSYLRDLTDVIRQIRPEMIICTDLDEHPDHRMLSLYTDRAIGILRREDPSFKPVLWKRFAYALAYTATPDYSEVNNHQTLRPQIGLTDKYEYDIIDKSIYRWASRVRIPVPDHDKSIRNNVIVKALLAHRSQHVVTRADRILNSDEVYWERRMDSVGCTAQVTASSGNPACLLDNLLLNLTDVDARRETFCDYCWKPADDDEAGTAVFTWEEPVTIERIALYGAVSTESGIDKVRIRLSDGFCTDAGPLPQSGEPLTVDTGHREGITQCSISIISCHGDDFGISECEFFSTKEYEKLIRPFVKLTVKGNFVYDHYITDDVTTLELGCYRYGDCGRLTLEVVSGKSVLDGKVLCIDREDKRIVVRVCDQSGDIWDRIVIHRLTASQLAGKKLQNKAEKRFLKRKRAEKKAANMLFILKKDGPGAVVRRTWNNVIAPGIRRLGS